MAWPISNFNSCRVNQTLHGRSVYRNADVPGHNVFKGYTTWANNGNRGVGDGLDLFAPAGTPVYAIDDAVVTVHRNDVTKLEVIYLQSTGTINWEAVYAHIDATVTLNEKVKAGQMVGKLRHDLSDPHLHFELWVSDTAVASRTARELQGHMYDVIMNMTKEVTPQAAVVDIHDWAKPSVEYCIDQRLLTRDSAGMFNGTKPITREELAVVLHRLGAKRA